MKTWCVWPASDVRLFHANFIYSFEEKMCYRASLPQQRMNVFSDFLQLGVLSTDFIIWQTSWLLSASNVMLFLAGLVDSFLGNDVLASMSATAANQLRSRFGSTWSAFDRICHNEDIMIVISFKRSGVSCKFHLFICGNAVLSSISAYSSEWTSFPTFYNLECFRHV